MRRRKKSKTLILDEEKEESWEQPQIFVWIRVRSFFVYYKSQT